MFETAVISYGPPTKRVWATCMGITGQALLITCAVLAPMISPQAIPKVFWAVSLAPPSLPPPPPPPPDPRVVPRSTRAIPLQAHGATFTVPVHIPAHPMVIDEPPEAPGGSGVIGGVPGGLAGGVPNGVVGSILSDLSRAVAPAKAPEPIVRNTAPAAAPAPKQAAPPRISEVEMAKPIFRVDPVYPPLARAARISGTVELLGVLGVDGRIHELKVLRGHPLLLEAALAAVKQWVYAPTLLNGQPVEVQAPIQVNFILNR